MTVETQVKKVGPLPGNDATTVFSFSPIVVFANSELEVTKTDAAGVETTLAEGASSTTYSVSIASLPGTGSITYPAVGGTPLPTGEFITIRRALVIEQQTDLENQGGYFPEVLEDQLDKLVMVDLQQQEELDRVLKAAVSDTVVDLTLPTATTRALKVLGFDAAGVPIATATVDAIVTSFMETVLDDTTALAARTTLASQEDVITTRGDIVRGSATNVAERLALGAQASLLRTSANDIEYLAPTHFRYLAGNGTDVLWMGGTKAEQAGNYTVVVGDHMQLIPVTAAAADRTVNLPAGTSSIDGLTVGIIMTGGGSAYREDNPTVNEVQIDSGATFTIGGLDQEFDLLVQDHTVWLMYEHATTDWRILSEKLPVKVQWVYTTGTPTWTRPKGKQWFNTIVTGGGGSGASEDVGVAFGGGGSAAGTAIATLQLTATTQAVTVGAGGAGQTGVDTAGNNGNNSTFSTLTGVAGVGGSTSVGVDGGIPTGGDFNYQGGGGMRGLGASGGDGGDSYWGGGTVGVGSTNNSVAAVSPGAGSGGAATGDSGAGADGNVVVETI